MIPKKRTHAFCKVSLFSEHVFRNFSITSKERLMLISTNSFSNCVLLKKVVVSLKSSNFRNDCKSTLKDNFR